MSLLKIEKIHKATSLDDAFTVLKENPGNCILGGSLWLKQSNKAIYTAIDLSDLSLDVINETHESFTIGSMVSLHSLERHTGIQTIYDGLLNSAIKTIMGTQLRNLATIGGSVMGRYAFSDILTALLAMNTTVIFHQAKEMSLETFINQKGKQEDILIGIRIPKENGRGYFKKVASTPLAFAILNIAVTKNNKETTIVVGSRPSIAKKASNAMTFLNGIKTYQEQDMIKASLMALDELKLSSNIRGSKSYREALLKTYVLRGLKAVNSDAS